MTDQRPRVFTDAQVQVFIDDINEYDGNAENGETVEWTPEGNAAIAIMLTDLIAQRQEVARLTAELDRRNALRDRVHASFKKRDVDGKCLCVYCTADAQGMEELAANYEMDLFSANQRMKELESSYSVSAEQIEAALDKIAVDYDFIVPDMLAGFSQAIHAALTGEKS